MTVQEITNRAFISRIHFLELMELNGVGKAVATDIWNVIKCRVQALLFELDKTLPSKSYYPTDLVLQVLEDQYGISKKALRRMK